MISMEALEKLSRKCQMGVFPNIVREYFQHVFLAELYKLPDAEKLLFKGGTALRIIYGSPRFSEDLDFSLFGVAQKEIKSFVERIFVHVLAEAELAGIKVEPGNKIGATSGGYFGVAAFRMFEFPPAYNLIHLPQAEIVEEKIFDALIQRKKPRDFYDLYIIMRKGMLSVDQKKRLGPIKSGVVADAKQINFKTELGAFLPIDQQGIIRDFL